MAKLGEEQVMVADQMVGRGVSIRQGSSSEFSVESIFWRPRVTLRA